MRHTEAISPALVVADDHAPVQLTEHGARKLIGQLRDCLALSDDLLVRAYTGRAWEALGYDTFEAMCAAEIPEFRMLKLKTGARRERVRAMRKAGATLPQCVAGTNSSLGSVHRDVVALEGGHTRETKAQPEPLADPYAGLSQWREAVARVAAQSDRGLTCRELEHETGWLHQSASPAMRKAETRGLVRRDGRFRLDGDRSYGVYVVTDAGRAVLEEDA